MEIRYYDIRKEVKILDSKYVGGRIMQLRKEKGYTQAKLAEALNVSNKTISRWETGDGFPDISILPQLVAELGTSIDTLLKTDEEKIETAPDHTIKQNGNLRQMPFILLLIYEAGCLCVELVATVLGDNMGMFQEEITYVFSAIRILLFILTVIIGIRMCKAFENSAQEAENLLLKTWLISLAAVAIYRICIRVAWLGIVNGSTQVGEAQEMYLLLAIFGVKVLRSMFVCACGFIAKKVLPAEKVSICFWILCAICAINICIQLAMFLTGNCIYSGMMDISVICTTYIVSMLFLLRRKENEKNN